MKMYEKSYSVVTVYAHPYIVIVEQGNPHFIHMNYHTLFLKMFQNIKFNEYENYYFL